MQEIRNKSRKPLRVPLGRGKVLHLGPGATGQVSRDAVERESFRKLIDAGEIELLGDRSIGADDDAPSSSPREATHGHHPPTVVKPRGNR